MLDVRHSYPEGSYSDYFLSADFSLLNVKALPF